MSFPPSLRGQVESPHRGSCFSKLCRVTRQVRGPFDYPPQLKNVVPDGQGLSAASGRYPPRNRHTFAFQKPIQSCGECDLVDICFIDVETLEYESSPTTLQKQDGAEKPIPNARLFQNEAIGFA
jgi:hypothetical protein